MYDNYAIILLPYDLADTILRDLPDINQNPISPRGMLNNSRSIYAFNLIVQFLEEVLSLLLINLRNRQ